MTVDRPPKRHGPGPDVSGPRPHAAVIATAPSGDTEELIDDRREEVVA